MSKVGYFGQFGGQFVPELLYPGVTELTRAFEEAKRDPSFQREFKDLLTHFAGRPTPLYFAHNVSRRVGCKVYLKREDLTHGGSHKLNNALGQVLLAKRMGKKRIVTETAAGMHGVATMMAANALDLPVEVYMGEKDIARQRLNADRIRLLGGIVHPVSRGHGVLKDAVSEATVDWIKNLPTTNYLVGSAVGPHPFPTLVRYFQTVIGKETKRQIMTQEGKLPKTIIACGSGGSNAIGMFQAFLKNNDVELVFVEGGGEGEKINAAAFSFGSVGIFQGAKTYVLQDKYGMDRRTQSRSAGLNYPARGPQLAYLFHTKRMKAAYATDAEVLTAYKETSRLEGIIPALETCHALAELFKRKGRYQADDIVVVNFSGRGDKDIETVLNLEKSL